MKFLLAPYAAVWFLTGTLLHGLTIQIDYTYDTGNFFNTPAKRSAMEAVARFFEEILADELLEIDASKFSNSSWTASFTHPATGNTVSLPNLVVPADTLIVYVGARALPSQVSGQGGRGGLSASGTRAWLDRVVGRGNPGALATPRTDFAPWGGAMTFNSSVAWNFSLTQNQPGREFVTVAMHEMMHILGIGTAPSWDALRSGGRFHGAAAVQSAGAPPQATSGHLQDVQSTLFGAFSVPHGLQRPALMLASSVDTGTNFDVATDLDLAVLEDIGWEVRPRPRLTVVALSPLAAEFSWPSVSFMDYWVERGDDLSDFQPASATLAGNGVVLQWTDPSPPAQRAFYRLVAEPNVTQAAPAAAMVQADSEGIMTLSVSYPWIGDCGCPGH